jgi:Ser/Thr protein kinase RdoA (MazF antagonist)
MREPGAAEDAPSMLLDLAASALQRWGMAAQHIELIKMRENAVFKIVDSDGAAYALRIHRAGYHSDDALRSEHQWVKALQAHGLDVPTQVPTLDGLPFVNVQLGGSPSSRQVDLFEWIHGRQLGTSEGGLGDDPGNIDLTYRTVGGIMAGLHNHATQWQLPFGFKRHRWDADGLVGERPLWGRFWELDSLNHDERRLLLLARERVRHELVVMASSPCMAGRFGLIHADFVPENLLRTPSGQVRLLDFDDAGFGWHLFDIATALYFIQDDPRYALAVESLVEGYRVHRKLTDALLEKLPVFMTARGFTYLGWVHSRPASSEGQAIKPRLVQLACRQAELLLA